MRARIKGFTCSFIPCHHLIASVLRIVVYLSAWPPIFFVHLAFAVHYQIGSHFSSQHHRLRNLRGFLTLQFFRLRPRLKARLALSMHIPRASWLLAACMGTIINASDILEVDLLFPRNETYAPTNRFPVVFAFQNSKRARYLNPQISYILWNERERHVFRDP